MTASLPASRRQIIKAAALAAVGLLGERFAGPALARPPTIKNGPPAFFPFSLGPSGSPFFSAGPLNRPAPPPTLFLRFHKDTYAEPFRPPFPPRTSRTRAKRSSPQQGENLLFATRERGAKIFVPPRGATYRKSQPRAQPPQR